MYEGDYLNKLKQGGQLYCAFPFSKTSLIEHLNLADTGTGGGGGMATMVTMEMFKICCKPSEIVKVFYGAATFSRITLGRVTLSRAVGKCRQANNPLELGMSKIDFLPTLIPPAACTPPPCPPALPPTNPELSRTRSCL
jgi:hypothetical protein